MRWLLIVICLSGCTSLGYSAGTISADGTELRFEDSQMRVQELGDHVRWEAFEFSAEPAIRLSAQGQTATIGNEPAVAMTGPMQVGATVEMCRVAGPGQSILQIHLPHGGNAQFNLEVKGC